MANPPGQVESATIVIAGASSGFGRGAALKLARQGANVVVAARRKKLLDELVGEMRDEGGKAPAVTADVSVPYEVEHIAHRAVEEYGRIDVWLNNVGVGALGYFWDIPLDVHARLIDVNLKGLIYGAYVALGRFIEQHGGTLVNTGSIDSEVPLALQNTYAATKSAVLSLGRSLNEELRLSGFAKHIKVATVMPWAVDTPWWTHAANYTGRAPRMAAMDDPEPVVEAIVKACTRPEEEMPVGPKARASDISHHVFPDVTERVSATVAGEESEKDLNTEKTNGALFAPMEEGRAIGGGIRERMKRESG